MTQNEIKFVERFEKEILPNRKNVNIMLLKEVASLIGVSVNSACRTCAATSSGELLNKYGLLKPVYDRIKSEEAIKPLEVNEIKKPMPVLKKQKPYEFTTD